MRKIPEYPRSRRPAGCIPFFMGLTVWLLVSWLPASASVATSSAAIEQQQAIRIAAIFSETGIAAPHNLPLVDMTRLAVDHVNNRGGVLGRQLQLILIDNGSTPIGSAQAAQKAVSEDVTAVIGAHWSSHSLAMAPILQEAGIPMISPGSTNPEVTTGKDHIFRACFVDSFQGSAMADFALKELHVQDAAVVTNLDEEYSTELGRFFSSAFQQGGGRVTVESSYRGTATDFAEIIKELVEKHPAIVYLPGYTRDSGLFVRQSEKMGLKTVFLGGDGWDEIEKYAGTSIEGSYQTAPWHPSVPFPASEEMKKLFVAGRGKSIENISSPLAYDAVMLLADAISRAGSLDRRAIRDALAATVAFPGATGPITFDGNGDPHNKAIIIIEFRDRKRLFRSVVLPAAAR